MNGVVQGVGMRPFVWRLARECGLTGSVANAADGVTVEVEGRNLARFLHRLRSDAPPLARLETLTVETIPAVGDAAFSILESRPGPLATRIGADAATCPACRRDLFDPASRFFGHPFVTCTHCGPRFTITRELPYDRPRTSMAGFPLCEACAADHANPADRRFHAEPISCPACGPRLASVDPVQRAGSDHSIDGSEGSGLVFNHAVSARAIVGRLADAVRDGGIVALKGIGGFHLVADARSEAAVVELRRRKGRDAKPFAVMVANAASLAAVADPVPAEVLLATSSAAPVVLMKARPGVLAPSVFPGLTRVGVMVAYAPVHHLLFAALGGATDPEAANPAVLVATSANASGDPLVADDGEAGRRLGPIADLIVGHDRPIVARCDDSVVQVIAGRPAFLRRARGFVPDPIALAEDGPVVLALGGHLKATVCVTRGREAFVSQHIGDLDGADTVRFYRQTIDRWLDLLGVRPEAVACDRHPDYRSSILADGFGVPVVRVQHHAAHAAAVAAEHGRAGPVLGLVLDGHGLGDDGAAWGGELLVVDGAGHRRLGHLAALPLPGGDRAAREPWRMAVGALHALGRGAEAAARFPDRALAGPLSRRLADGREPLVTTSLGRLFDAAAGLLGLRAVQDHEGQAAMELEARARTPRPCAGGWTLAGGTLSFAPLLDHLATARCSVEEGADLLHGTLIDGLSALAIHGAAASGLDTVALAGGCLMNRLLAEGLVAALSDAGLRPLLPERLPPNDGGLSFGQAVVARAGLAAGRPGTLVRRPSA